MAEQRVFVPMQDGVRLAASLFLPDEGSRGPALLEARPYRKDDLSPGTGIYRRLRDEGGFAVVRVDVRGTGSSEGIAEDEYSFQERRDLVAVLDWIARQPWCNGSVGMFGWSYSGFNSLQLAMERPRPLKGICAIFASDDRYTDDVHYQGGIRHALDFVDYPLFMVAMNALPPVPGVVGDDWRDLWSRRLDGTEPWVLRWLQEQNDTTYWRYGSVRPRYDQIKVPTFIVGGWADGYRTAAVRLYERLRCDKRLLIGPWSHMDPEVSIPGPRIDLVPVMIRWWNHVLRGRDEGLSAEPPITVFVRRSTAPEPDLDAYRGSWRFETEWPPSGRKDRPWPLADAAPATPLGILETRGDVGWTSSIWCAGHLPFGPPFDQRPDEVHSLVFDWPVLSEELEILGTPRAEIIVRASEPVAFLSAKLCDVFPDGTSALVARGVVNLTHRNSHAEPEPVEAGERYRIRLDLDATSWIFEPGHRIRLDLAGADWPNVWPPPTTGRLTIAQDASSLVLPVIEEPRSPDATPPPFLPGAPEGERPDPPPEWGTSEDVLRQERVVWIAHAHGRDEPDADTPPTRVSYAGEAGVSLTDPGVAWAEGRVSYEITWPEATVTSEAHGRLTSDAETWHLLLELKVRDGDDVIHVRRWDKRFPRALQ